MTGMVFNRGIPTTAVMARRRHTGRSHPWGFVLAGLLVTAGLAASIHVAGEVTNLRGEIQSLRAECEELSAGQAVLRVAWNSETSRQRIMRRAVRELGLTSPAEPTLTLVASAGPRLDGSRRLAALDLLTRAVPAAAADERP